MATKRLYIITLVLSIAAAIQCCRYFMMEDVDEDILLAEMANYKAVSLGERQALIHMYQDLEGHALHPIRPRSIKAYADAKYTYEKISDVVSLLSRAYREGHNRSESHALVKRACDIQEEAIKLIVNHKKTLLENRIADPKLIRINDGPLDENFPWLDMRQREYNLLLNYTAVLEMYRSICDNHWYMFVDGDLFMGNLGLKYLPDTVEVFMPTVIQGSEKVRIEIAVSKKYFDHLIDSLQTTGIIPVNRRPFYKGIISLNSDDLHLESLTHDRQVISEHDYTLWYYDVSGETSGVKHLRCKVGVIVLDSLENASTFYVPLELPTLQLEN